MTNSAVCSARRQRAWPVGGILQRQSPSAHGSFELDLHCCSAAGFTVAWQAHKGVFQMSNMNKDSDKNQGQPAKNPKQGGQQDQGNKPGQGGQQNQGQRDNSGGGQQTGGDKSNTQRKEI
jgi:hypothetical protein